MAVSELDSFLLKFKHLLHAGLKASLNVEAENGEAFITLKVGLGQVPPPQFHFQRPPSQHHRGPAYWRRQEQREAAKLLPGPVQGNSTSQRQAPVQDGAGDDNSILDDKVAEKAIVADKAGLGDEHSMINHVAEKATENNDNSRKVPPTAEKEFRCQLCDFVSKWNNGLSIHIAKKHGKIEQLDGHSDVCDDENYFRTRNYWSTGYLGTVYQTYLDALDLIKKSDLNESEKEKEIAKVLEARKDAFGPNYKYNPPWSK